MGRKRRSRRQFIGDAVGAVAGVAVAAGLTSRTGGTAAAAQSAVQLAEVVRQEGDSVLVTGGGAAVPMAGFPAGWRLQPGERVALTQSADGAGLVAMPLVSWATVDVEPASLRPGSDVVVTGRRLHLPAASVVPADAGGQVQVCVVDHGRSTAAPSVIAVRPV